MTRVGGLSDTVIDANEMALAAGVATGVQFFPSTAIAWRSRCGGRPGCSATGPLGGPCRRTAWGRMSPGAAAHRYASLYRELCGLEVETAGAEIGDDASCKRWDSGFAWQEARSCQHWDGRFAWQEARSCERRNGQFG